MNFNVDAFDHALVKGLRDLLVIEAGTVSASIASGGVNPRVLLHAVWATAALYLYRVLRENGLLSIVGIDAKGGTAPTGGV